jgi:basic membrane lipoprotein Med (substrate-binding protein (PBP1-ABC) superfamily)
MRFVSGRTWRALALASGFIASVAVVDGGEAAAQEQLKVAAVFETPIEEPWVNQIHVALLQAKDEFGIEYTWSESVSASDFARVLSGYAEQDHDLIMGDSFGTERITRRVARDYPEVAFAFGSGIGPAEPNFGVFDNWIHEPAYLAGMIAGKLTGSNVVGTVAAMPIPEVNRLSNAFCAGAKEVNEAVKCKFSFIGSFFDPPKAKEAAIAQIEAGVDVIYGDRGGGRARHSGDRQHVRPVRTRARHRDHQRRVGHVADREAGDQPGPGRRVHGTGFRPVLLHGQRRLVPRALPRLGGQAA